MNTLIKNQIKPILNKMLEHYPKEIKGFFVHGSAAEGKESDNSYREDIYFFDNKFIFSNFTLQKMPFDVDVIVIANNLRKVAYVAEKIIREMKPEFTVTINFITPEEYARVVESRDPVAPKVILIYKKIIVLYGENLIKNLIKIAKKNKTKEDLAHYRQFNAKKKILGVNKKNNIINFVINRKQYASKFPFLLDVNEGNIVGGFSVERIKYVYLRKHKLKRRVRIN